MVEYLEEFYQYCCDSDKIKNSIFNPHRSYKNIKSEG